MTMRLLCRAILPASHLRLKQANIFLSVAMASTASTFCKAFGSDVRAEAAIYIELRANIGTRSRSKIEGFCSRE
ncbi:hypothetical protein BJY00DRAFT_83901 [Aspergillus carlsbadensis]|nr:hypothetical protein BJY00DRAFT_83901 [Aspergillus carlsbadensis]